jgi:hypothetical protein
MKDKPAGTPTDTKIILLGNPTTGAMEQITLAQLKSYISASQLATPTGFTATAAGSTQINLAWSAVTNATSYTLDWSANGTTGWTNVYTGSGVSTSHTGLTASTTYYYRVKATASGFTDSAYANSNATTGTAVNYLTWTTIGTDMEQYNTSQGMRKKSTASASWTPTSATQSVATQTLSSGQKLYFKIGSTATLATSVMLCTGSVDMSNPASPAVPYWFTAAYNLTANAQVGSNGVTYGTTFAITAGDLWYIDYSGGVIRMYQNGTLMYTSGVSPSGSYTIKVQSYSVLGGFDQMYIV